MSKEAIPIGLVMMSANIINAAVLGLECHLYDVPPEVREKMAKYLKVLSDTASDLNKMARQAETPAPVERVYTDNAFGELHHRDSSGHLD